MRLPTALPASDEAFQSAGFLGPISVLTPHQCALLHHRWRFGQPRTEPEWSKGLAVVDRCIYDVATRPSILDRLEALIGPDLVLWGARFVHRVPGRRHAWHTDMESSRPEGGFASVWIGIRNTSGESALQFIPGSHLYGSTVQELEHHAGGRDESVNPDKALALARAHDPSAELIQPEMVDGDAIFFDGRLWHGSHNRRETGARLALLLQYARASVGVRRPQSDSFAWPFVFADEPPPVLAVRGAPDATANRIVDRPPAGGRNKRRLHREISPLRLPLPTAPDKPWTPHQMFRGWTRTHDFMDVHASVLQPGHSPHPPHAHIEEEILMVIDGQAEVLIGGPNLEDASPVSMSPGSFTYYPAWRFHTIRNASDMPVSYLMFKWRSAPFEARKTLGVRVHQTADVSPPPSTQPGRTYHTLKLMENPTNFLGRLQAHLTEMEPGGGYDSHSDRYDVAIVVLSGRLDTGAEVLEPVDVAYYAAGVPHGLRNIGEDVARYLVLEFEDPRTAAAEARRRAKARAKLAAESAA